MMFSWYRYEELSMDCAFMWLVAAHSQDDWILKYNVGYD